MATEVFSDGAQATLISGGNTTPAQLTVETWTVSIASGVTWPTVGGGVQTRFVCTDTGEICILTSGVTTPGTQNWSVTRGAEGTATSSHTGTQLVGEITAGSLGQFIQLSPASAQLGNLSIQSLSSGSVAGIFQGAVSQTADLFQWQDISGNVLARFNSQGAGRIAGSASPAIQGSSGAVTLNTNATTGGTLAAGVWTYRMSAVDANGLEGPCGAAVAVTTTGATSAITLNTPTGPTGTTKRNIYRSPVGGSVLYYLATIADNTALTYQDTGSVALSTKLAPLGAYQALLMLGSAPFDGATSGFFSGNLAGTVLGVNMPASSQSNALDVQQAGVSKMVIAANGNISSGLFQGIGGGPQFTTSTTGFTSASQGATQIPLRLQGTTLQTADLLRAIDISANILAKIDAYGNIATVALPVPGVPTLAVVANATGVDAGAHTYGITFVNANGETTIGTTAIATTTAGNLQVNLSAIPLGPNGVTSRHIWRSKAGTTTPLFLVATLADNTTATYSDSATDASLPTTQPPITNYTAGRITWGPYSLSIGNSSQAQLLGGGLAALAGTSGFLDVTMRSSVIANANTASRIVLAVAGMASQTGDLQQWQNSTPAALFRLDANGRLGSNQVAANNLPTIAAGVQGSSASLGTGSTDVKGTVIVTATSTPGILATITYNASSAYTGVPVPILTRQDAIAGEVYISATSATSFTISTKTGISAGALTIGYHVIGG